MSLRWATPGEVARWDDLLVANPDGGDVFASSELVGLKERFQPAWTGRYLVADSVAVTVLERSVPGLGRFWYLPKGPGVTTADALGALVPQLGELAAGEGVFLIALEPAIVESDGVVARLGSMGLRKAENVQPNASTVIVPLSGSAEDVLKAMPSKGRYSIRRAERDGVVVDPVEPTDENCHAFFDLLAATAQDAKFPIRSEAYYRAYWQDYARAGIGQLFFARVDGTLVAGAYALAFGARSTYKDGASVRDRPAYGASNALQWAVISWALGRGSRAHDLCGAPHSSRVDDATDPYHGIGQFKRSFHPEITDFVGTWELVVRPRAVAIWDRVGFRVARRLAARSGLGFW